MNVALQSLVFDVDVASEAGYGLPVDTAVAQIVGIEKQPAVPELLREGAIDRPPRAVLGLPDSLVTGLGEFDQEAFGRFLRAEKRGQVRVTSGERTSSG